MGGPPQLSAVEWAQPEVLFAFLDELRSLEFNLGTAHYAAVQDLLLVLVAEGRAAAGNLPWQRSVEGAEGPEHLARLLGPVVCNTPREQQDLPRLIALWAAGQGKRLSESVTARNRSEEAGARASGPDRDAETAAERRDADERSLEETLRRIERGTGTWLGPTVVLLVILAGAALYYYQVFQEVGPVPVLRGLRKPEASWPLGALLTVIGGVGGAYAFWRLWLRRLGRQFLVRRSATTAPRLDNLSIHASSDDLFTPHALRYSGEQLRRRVAVVGRELDVEATVERTTRAGGWPVPVAGHQLVRPEYLVLIERASPGDQRSRFFDELSLRLRAQGVALERAYFDGDPRTCFRSARRETGADSGRQLVAALEAAPGDPTTLDAARGSWPEREGATAATAALPLGLRDLYSLYPEHRLLLISNGDGLFSPISGEEVPWIGQLLAWKQRAVLIPRPVADWGRRERELARRFAVVPATVAGWGALAATFEGRTTVVQEMAPNLGAEAPPEAPLPEELRSRSWRWLERNPPEPWRVEQVLDDLEVSLGEAGFYWLAACAVYPALDLEMTVSLGRMLVGHDGKPLYAARRLEILLDLPWLRHGSMPDWLRQSLLARLPRRRDAEVRAALETLLLSALDRRGALADGAFMLELASRHQRALSHLWRPVWRRLARRPQAEGLARDYVFRDFMAGRRQRLAVALPDRVARLFRRRGQESARENIVESLPMRRARWVMRAALLLAPVSVFLGWRSVGAQPWAAIDKLFAGWTSERWAESLATTGIFLPYFASGPALLAVANLWQKRRLMAAGIYWSAVPLAVAVGVLLSNLRISTKSSLGLLSLLLAIGCFIGHRVGPMPFLRRSVRLERIQLVLGPASALYLGAVTCLALSLVLPLSGGLKILGLYIDVSVGGGVLAVALCESSALLFLAATPLVAALFFMFSLSFADYNGIALGGYTIWSALGAVACLRAWYIGYRRISARESGPLSDSVSQGKLPRA